MAVQNQYARLTREDWDRLGASRLAQELFNILNTPGAGSGTATTAAASTGTGTGATTGGGTQQVFQGSVVSGGPGSNYQVQLETGTTVAAVQMTIDPAETIPAGTITPVYLLTDGTYRIQVPVWE